MIFGVDHIALSATGVDGGSRALASLGYGMKFSDLGLPNASQKKPFLSGFHKVHDIAYCQPETGVAIELTVHGPVEGTDNSPYRLVFSGRTPGLRAVSLPMTEEPVPDAVCSAFGTDAAALMLNEFDALAYCLDVDEPTANARVGCVALACGDLEAGADFWKALGFVESGRSARGWRLLEFKSHVPSWCLTVLLYKAGNRFGGNYNVDQPGVTCIALITSDMSAERESLRQRASFVGDTFRFQVGGKALDICMLRGPGGECVELIQIAREV